MEKIETRMNCYLREQLEKVQLNLVEQKREMEEHVTKFDKQINDYRSQVLWRIKDCEELLKSRCSTQEVQDLTKALETRLKAKLDIDIETL